jgi:cytochrome c-type biogenesis protein
MIQEHTRIDATDAAAATISARSVFAHALLFVLGFSLVFVVGWGGAATVVGQLFGQYKSGLAQIGGVVVILFGLHTIGLLQIPWLYYDLRPQWSYSHKGGFLSSGLMGIFFAAGWTPCIGITLGAILTLGLSQQSTGQAMVLASGYALGLGIPFLALGLVVARATTFIGRVKPHLRKIQMASGFLLVLIGLMLLTQQMIWIAIWAQRNGLFLDLSLGGTVPTYPVAILAGLISFLSPCVLPLVPAYLGYLSGQAVRQS